MSISMTSQCNPKSLCIREPKRDKRIRVKPSIFFKKKTLINKLTNISMHVIKEKLKFLNLIVKQFLRSKTCESGIQTIC